MTTSISPGELKDLCRTGKLIELIDVRTPAEFREMHLEFARNIPLEQVNSDLFRERKSNEPLYFICQKGGRGLMACQRLEAAGFSNAINVEGGTVACETVGLPMVHGKKTISVERQVRIAAGSLVLIGVLLGWLVHPAWFGLSALIGAGLVFAGITDTCGMGVILARMPWNQLQETPNLCVIRQGSVNTR